ncbi:desiccation protectant protein Lea14-like protein [Hibiscus syriacus]|uniref:Desiccation protectant protein Lea14-like protein n=1 Tax=Hibiscus syriacus TaxID=106335 RepID=A0A6A3A9L0_HIBSY|nr:desiccation protectant protein Lea14-like protein [Hibiscus syriacus]
MVGRDQVRPLAPAADARSSDDGEATSQLKKSNARNSSNAADPIIKLNGVSITHLELINSTSTVPIPRPGSNISLTADVSVKNPNIASFKYRNTTTTLYYYSTVVGEARGPGASAKARRTMQMNITVDIMTDRLLASPNLVADVGSRTLTMSSYSRIGGRINMLSIIRGMLR